MNKTLLTLQQFKTYSAKMLFPTIFSVNTCLQHYGFHREENVILSYTQLVTVNISLTAYPVKDNVNAKSVFTESCHSSSGALYAGIVKKAERARGTIHP